MRVAELMASWTRRRGVPRPAEIRPAPPWAKAHYLSEMEVFRDLSAEDVQQLAETTTMVSFPRGQVVFRPGDSSLALYLLKHGRVQIVRDTKEGKRLVTAVLAPGTFFGEMALVGQRVPQDSTAEAVEDAVVCVLARDDLERLILEHPKVGLRFLEQVSARLIETEAVVEDLAFKPVRARLAGLLLRLAEAAPDGTVRASHQELADMVASHRETVTLTLDQLRDRGLLELGRRSIRLLDRDALEREAQP